MIHIRLPADLDNDLSWKKETLLAESGEIIFWHIDFTWEKISLSDRQRFLTMATALEHFSKTLWNEKAVGLCIYKGGIDFSKQFIWDDLAQENFREWIVDMGKENTLTPLDFQIFCANAFGEYLQRLSSFLPDTLPVHAEFDTYSPILLSKERFSHIHIQESKSSIAVCLPADQYISNAFVSQLEELLENGDYRVIPESLLTEEWNQVETIMVFPKCLSPSGKRKLAGFEAAGGKVVCLDEHNVEAAFSFLFP